MKLEVYIKYYVISEEKEHYFLWRMQEDFIEEVPFDPGLSAGWTLDMWEWKMVILGNKKNISETI